MWQKILLSISKKLLTWAFNMLYNYVDSNNDGVLDKDEIAEVVDMVRKHARRLKNKSMK